MVRYTVALGSSYDYMRRVMRLEHLGEVAITRKVWTGLGDHEEAGCLTVVRMDEEDIRIRFASDAGARIAEVGQ